MLRTVMTLGACLLTAFTLSATAQEPTASALPKDHPGYWAFDAQSVMGGRVPNPDVQLPKGLLMAGAAMFDKDIPPDFFKQPIPQVGPDDAKRVAPPADFDVDQLDLPGAVKSLGEVCKSLDFLRVQTFKDLSTGDVPAPDAATVRTAVEKEVQRMANEGWVQVSSIEQKPKADDAAKNSGHITVLMKYHNNGNMLGMALFLEKLPQKFLFINMGGNIPPDLLGKFLSSAIPNQEAPENDKTEDEKDKETAKQSQG